MIKGFDNINQAIKFYEVKLEKYSDIQKEYGEWKREDDFCDLCEFFENYTEADMPSEALEALKILDALWRFSGQIEDLQWQIDFANEWGCSPKLAESFRKLHRQVAELEYDKSTN